MLSVDVWFRVYRERRNWVEIREEVGRREGGKEEDVSWRKEKKRREKRRTLNNRLRYIACFPLANNRGSCRLA